MPTENLSPDDLTDFAELLATADTAPPEHGGPRRRSRRKQRGGRRRGGLIALLVVVVVLGAVGGYAGWALNAPLPVPVASVHNPAVPVTSAAEVPLPSDGASAIRLSGADKYFAAAKTRLDLTSGTTKPLTIASITKVVTALVVLDARPLSDADDHGPMITWSKANHDLYDKYYVMGATIATMPIGSSMSEYDALATMLLPSACNYADALATWAYGSQWSFVAATRAWLADHGLKHTTIVEPTGLSHENRSTPADLVKIGKLAAANPVVAKIAGTASLVVPGAGMIRNTNDLLGTDGITGLKTGNLGYGSFCLLYTADVNVQSAGSVHVIGAVLGGGSRESIDGDVKATLDGIYSGFHMVPVAETDQRLGTYTTAWGSSARLVVSESASVFTWSDTPITVSMKTATPKDYTDGEVVGQLTWTAGPRTAKAKIAIDGDITPPDAWWRLTHPFELG